MKILVTGATGFIGSHLVRHLLQKGLSGQRPQILCLVRRSSARDRTLPDGVQVLEGDLEDLPQYREIVKECECVFHLAGQAKLSGKDPWRNNLEGTRHLLASLSGSTSLRRLVFTSTIGAVDRQPTDTCQIPLNESTAPFPLSEYGRSKLECERLIEQSGLPYAILRPTWVYGPGMRSDSHIRVFLGMVQQGKPASKFYFPGRVSVIHIDDLVACLALVAVDSRAAGQIFFAADGSQVSIGDLFRSMGEWSGQNAGRWAIPDAVSRMMQILRPRLPLAAQNLFSNVLWADASKLNQLGFQPRVPFQQGLLQMTRWHNEQSVGGALPPNKVSLVTGAAGGIGRAVSRMLYARGHNLLLVDKNEQDLVLLAQELGARFMALDLTQQQALFDLERYIHEHELNLNWVINNAGIGVRGRVTDIEFERQHGVIDLNCTAVTFISQMALRSFGRTGQGTLINIASSAAFQPLPFMAVYAATKAYVSSYSRAICGEVSDKPDIHVLTASPSGTATNFQAASGVAQNPGEKLLAPVWVAAQIIRAADQKKTDLIVGRSGKMMALLGRVLPTGLQVRLWRRMMQALR